MKSAPMRILVIFWHAPAIKLCPLVLAQPDQVPVHRRLHDSPTCTFSNRWPMCRSSISCAALPAVD